MRSLQFSLKTMLWLVVVASAFFGGAAWQHERERPVPGDHKMVNGRLGQEMVMPDGQVWLTHDVTGEKWQKFQKDHDAFLKENLSAKALADLYGHSLEDGEPEDGEPAELLDETAPAPEDFEGHP